MYLSFEKVTSEILIDIVKLSGKDIYKSHILYHFYLNVLQKKLNLVVIFTQDFLEYINFKLN